MFKKFWVNNSLGVRGQEGMSFWSESSGQFRFYTCMCKNTFVIKISLIGTALSFQVLGQWQSVSRYPCLE